MIFLTYVYIFIMDLHCQKTRRSGKRIEMSVSKYQKCELCVQLEVNKLLSLSLDLGIEPKSREDVLNLIRISDYSSLNEDIMFIEEVIDAFMQAA